jgi:AraC-like DNA-binding protein
MPPMTSCLYQPFPMQGTNRGQVWRYAPAYRRPRHFHAEPELNLVVSGQGQFGTGDTVFCATARDLIYWPAGLEHELLETSHDFDLYVVALTPELSERVLGDEHTRAMGGPLRVSLSAAQFEPLHALSGIPVNELEAGVVENHVAELWRSAHATRSLAHGGSALGQRILASLLTDPELSRSARAARLRTHPTDVSRHFHRTTGIRLVAHRTRLRLLRLIQIMETEPTTLLDAALDAGFGSYSQCHRAFQQVLGCAPRQFLDGGFRREMFDAFAPWPPAQAPLDHFPAPGKGADPFQR